MAAICALMRFIRACSESRTIRSFELITNRVLAMTPDDRTEPAYDPRKLDEYIADLCFQCGAQAVLDAVKRYASSIPQVKLTP